MFLEFVSTVIGNFQHTLQKTYNNGVGVQTLNIQLSGSSQSALSLTPSGVWDFGTLPSGSFQDRTFVLTHLGGGPANTVAVSLLNQDDFTIHSSGCATLLSSGTCEFVIRYTAGVLGAASDVLTVSYDDGFTTQNIVLDLEGESQMGGLMFMSVHGESSGHEVQAGVQQIDEEWVDVELEMSNPGFEVFYFDADFNDELQQSYVLLAENCFIKLLPQESCRLKLRLMRPAEWGDWSIQFNVVYRVRGKDFHASKFVAFRLFNNQVFVEPMRSHFDANSNRADLSIFDKYSRFPEKRLSQKNISSIRHVQHIRLNAYPQH